MDNKIKTWLFDIKIAIEEIENFFEPDQMLFEVYVNDIRTKRAIERNIEIIGEAVNRILKVNENIEITDSRRIVDTRNRIIHGYDSISDDMIWAIVINHLPGLKSEVEFLLKK